MLALRHDKGLAIIGPHAGGVPDALDARVILLQAQPGGEGLERFSVDLEMVGVEQSYSSPQQSDVSVEAVLGCILGLVHPALETEAVAGVNDVPQAQRNEC